MKNTNKALFAATLLTALFSSQAVIADEAGLLDDEYAPYTESTETERVNFAIETPKATSSVDVEIFPEPEH